jgi:hypothetical protein
MAYIAVDTLPGGEDIVPCDHHISESCDGDAQRPTVKTPPVNLIVLGAR